MKVSDPLFGMSTFSSPFMPRGTVLAFNPATLASLINILDEPMPESPRKPQSTVLNKADAAVNNDRQAEYGDPVENAVREALVATIVARKPITPNDTVQVMSAKKMVRSGTGKNHEDSNVDQAGYADIRDRVQKATDSGEIQQIVRDILGGLQGWVRFGYDKKVVDDLKAENIRLRAQKLDLEKQNARLNEWNSNQRKTIDVLQRQSREAKEAVRGTLSEPVRVITKAACDIPDCPSHSETSVMITLRDASVTALTSSEFNKRYKLVEVK